MEFSSIVLFSLNESVWCYCGLFVQKKKPIALFVVSRTWVHFCAQSIFWIIAPIPLNVSVWDKLFIFILISCSPLSLNTHWLTVMQAGVVSDTKKKHLLCLIIWISSLIQAFLTAFFFFDRNQGFVECVLMDDQCLKYLFGPWLNVFY